MLLWRGKQKNNPHNNELNKKDQRSSAYSGQSGNVLALLFGAVVMTGVVAATSMEMVLGPVQTITNVTQKNIADQQMTTNAKLVVLEAATHSNNRDNDSDGFVEPIEYVPNGASGCAINFTGGGCLPDSMGATMRDPFGRPFAYCVWDHGSVDNGHSDSSPSSPYRLQGTTDPTHPVIALISAGHDQEFQTSCAAFDGSGDEGIVKPVGSDDWVFTYTYEQATAASSGLWQLKTSAPDTAEISKNLEVTNASSAVTVAIGRDTGIGDFFGVTTDLITAKTGGSITLDAANFIIDGGFLIGSDGSGADGGIEITSDNDPNSFVDFKGTGNEASDYMGRILYNDANGFQLYVNGGGARVISILNDGDVAIGVNTPHASAALDITATNQGFLPPRMNTSQRNGISSPATGLLIHNSQEQALQIFDGTNWIDVGTTLWELAGSTDAVYTAGSAGVGATTVNAGAAFELTSTTKGFLPPRMDESQRDNISSPAEGLIVYNTDTQMPEFWDGSQWVCMAGGSSTTTTNFLYSFSSHTFTNCSQTGRTGPSLSQCRSAYSTSWDSNNSYFSMSTNGIQEWTVPATGTYRITAAGARGGYNNSYYRGAQMRGDFNLTQGEKLYILVGQYGTGSTYFGGGGGSFVAKGTTLSNTSPLIVAGGGGGADTRYNNQSSHSRGTTSQTGQNSNSGGCSSSYTGGSSGNGGQGSSNDGGGGGFTGNGTGGGPFGYSFRNGGSGGSGSSGDGGFGGGGGISNDSGGGGGGYSGGASCGENGNGAGGGSYNSGSNQSNSAGSNSGHGFVNIELVSATPVQTSRCGSRSLFNFTSHTFNNCGQTGQNGPSLSNCRSAYSTTWDSNNSYFNMSTNGIQQWTVPETATYRITVAGARGGDGRDHTGGRGRVVRGDFTLNSGEQLDIVVGQMGTNHSSNGGGGGGSFVWKTATGRGSNPMIAAGGGGGGGYSTSNGLDGTTSTSGNADSSCGTSGGSGGGAGTSNSPQGGGGWNANGTGSGTVANSSTFRGGNQNGGAGGFGIGGAGTSSDNGAGGAGGYSGGGAGCDGGNGRGGGGGGLFNSGANANNNVGTNNSHGYVTIQKL